MAWKPLHLSASASNQLPAFLISACFGSTSYTVHLTDLTHIWSESLQRRDIIRRSQEENTSIDPSDAEQLHILLQKIELGLADDEDTTAATALSIGTDDERPRLILNLTVALPGGLAALQWPIRLSASPQSLFTSHLTLPLLEAQHARMQEITSLAEALREKDHVIQRMLDKLEAKGMELGEVFPQAAGKAGRKVDRKKAEERVKGLAQFDIRAWREGLNTNVSHDTKRMISEVFNTNGLERPAIEARGGSLISAAGSQEVAWWEEIRGITVNLQTGKISTSFSKPNLRDSKPPPEKSEKASRKVNASKTVKKQLSGSETDDDDAFQVQDTPPSKRLEAKKPESYLPRDYSDSDDDDLDAPSQRSNIPDSFPVSQPLARDCPSPVPRSKTKALGKIGGKKKAPPPPIEDGSTEDDSLPLHKPTGKVGAIGDKKSTPKPLDEEGSTEGETSPLRARSPSPAAPPEDGSTEDETTPPPRQLSKVDKSTLKPKACDNWDETSTEDDAASPPTKNPPKATEPAPSKAKKGMLGKIGGKKELPKAPTPEPPEVEPGPEPEPIAIKPKKGKLGKIGGKKNQAAPTVPTTSQSSGTPPPLYPDETSSPKKKLGIVGGRNIKDESFPEKGEERGRPVVKEEREKTLEVRETSAERAEKKRAALKRELEAKKSAPVKKKRKF
ncbi:XRCC4-like factor-domain-containing protein [Tricladium varicosporioides]|nr:XRCC4-like factor-domain-containing protein [Hymenoscyphus varicosporioides]